MLLIHINSCISLIPRKAFILTDAMWHVSCCSISLRLLGNKMMVASIIDLVLNNIPQAERIMISEPRRVKVAEFSIGCHFIAVSLLSQRVPSLSAMAEGRLMMKGEHHGKLNSMIVRT